MLNSQKMEHGKMFDQILKLSHEKISVPELITLLDIHYNDMFHVNPWMKKEIKKLAYEFVKNDPNQQLSKHDACDLVEAFINVPVTSLERQSISSSFPLYSTSVEDISSDFSADSSLLPQSVTLSYSLSRSATPEHLSDDSFVAAFQKTRSHFAYSDSLLESTFSNIQNCIASIQNVKKEDVSSQLVELHVGPETSLPSSTTLPSSSKKAVPEPKRSKPSQQAKNYYPISNVWELLNSSYYIKACIALLISIILFFVLHTSSKSNPSKTRPS
ncbi:hypothetical protein SPOG_02385 [Schizosaccharomyces cryophilus OY26]|uniref:Uncharacterized protein n=1 Tax=Schizosaccharomyces cryophilus (strain OY26 / ATCC MYA-4695 / CBS 11777 / NBRC 106824 / NRRL Y48691) TaxID=653667 RepID=S9VY86_SCHCR|nr:uncharacterized protein SPOG_02385 [Schizosaccharomyces cryophilus OY26]EPY51209.1 hypothetical protein SPOG_02385 [Schizosaccharomyces cryophilus OY26]